MAAETTAINEKGVAAGGLTTGSQPVHHDHDEHGNGAHGHTAHPHWLMHHFDDLAQQRETITLGMWSFLITEIMMFGGLFFVYTLYRWMYHPAYVVGSHQLDWKLGTINTCVLLVSSLTMALAVHAAQLRDKKKLILFMVLTAILGLAFLGIKAVEWTHDWHIGLIPGLNWAPQGVPANVDPMNLQLFFVIYFCMTGLHAIHMIIGLSILAYFIWLARKGDFSEGNDQPIELFGLYWHFVDVVWVFLFPLLYLTGGLVTGGGGH
jgi:cytochrome c oxidase subunit 3